VRGFLAFAATEQGRDVTLPRIKGPKKPRSVPRPISPDEAVALAEEVAEDARLPWIAARDSACCCCSTARACALPRRSA
jgi:integrase/recombinase XerC